MTPYPFLKEWFWVKNLRYLSMTFFIISSWCVCMCVCVYEYNVQSFLVVVSRFLKIYNPVYNCFVIYIHSVFLDYKFYIFLVNYLLLSISCFCLTGIRVTSHFFWLTLIDSMKSCVIKLRLCVRFRFYFCNICFQFHINKDQSP